MYFNYADLNLENLIERGGFGSVYKLRNKKTNKDEAIKHIPLYISGDKERKKFFFVFFH